MSFFLTTDIINEKYFCGQITKNLDEQHVFKYLNNLSLLTEDCIDVLKTGRNTISKVSLRGSDGISQYIDCAFKHFSSAGFIKRFGSWVKGSKAKRTWDNSIHLAENSIGVSFPFLFVDMKDGEGVFVSEYLSNRVSLRDKLIDILIKNPDINIVSTLLMKVARSIRLMHDAGFQHNDLGNQNILLKEEDNGDVSSVEFIDLNRGYIRTKLSTIQVSRDLSRLTLPGGLRKIFDEYYFLNKKIPLLYRFSLNVYLVSFSVHTLTRRYRHSTKRTKNSKRESWIYV